MSLIKSLSMYVEKYIEVCIAAMLLMQQLYTTRMVELIISITVVDWYLFSVCLWFCLILRKICFMEYLLVVASTYIKCDTENYIKEVKLYSIQFLIALKAEMLNSL